MTNNDSKQEPNSGKVPVRLRITSLSDDHRIEQSAEGDLYRKGRSVYIRYPEPAAEMGNTMTTLRVEDDEIRVIRHGDVRSEQTFIPGGQRIGHYETAQGRFELDTRTKEARIDLTQGMGSVTWQYELYVGGSLAGTFRLTVEIAPIHQ